MNTQIGDVTYMGHLDKCNTKSCNKTDLVDHHISYEPKEIIKVLCKSCHIKFHKKHPDEMRLSPLSSTKPIPKNKWTTISLRRTTKHQLENYAIDVGMTMNKGWNDFLIKLLDDAKTGYSLKTRYGLK